ncbi:DUF3574 domain-containing protein [Luteimonas sp. Y-2-2-4F]|nr:DUF3574 domain-containing protein [Luteimonas sp. Y-2-2-4F]MCD9030620.1 DUF3574 domain-containing protein [Luteimonas sp. Y-2-2-4F]
MRARGFRPVAICLAAMLALAGCASVHGDAAPAPVTATLHDDPAHPALATGWLRSELYFGVGPDGDAPVDPAGWREFLDREVTPRFPDGLSVFDAYGQWLSREQATPGRLRSKLLVILHPDTPEHRARIDAIRVAWKRETGHQSVLWSWQRVDVSF